MPAEVPVGHDACERIIFLDDGNAASLRAGHGNQSLADGLAGLNRGAAFAGTHNIAHAQQQRAANGAARMQLGIICDFEAVSLGRRFVGDGFFVALDGDELVGLTEPQPVDDVPNAIEQNLTGVRSDYRGRGIAFALKSQAAIWAAQAGYTSIRTQNAQSNVAMLAVNERLGFERKRATIEYLKAL